LANQILGEIMFRTIILTVLVIAVGTAFAGPNCASQNCRAKCDPPDWGYTYQTAEFAPDHAPCAVKTFHDKLIPLMEARWSHESSYIYDNACELYCAAKKVPGSLKTCCDKQKEHFNNAAHDLVHDCARLKEIAHGASSRMMYDQIKLIEDDYIRVCNLTEDE
jgi:hypothetical protein